MLLLLYEFFTVFSTEDLFEQISIMYKLLFHTNSHNVGGELDKLRLRGHQDTSDRLIRNFLHVWEIVSVNYAAPGRIVCIRHTCARYSGKPTDKGKTGRREGDGRNATEKRKTPSDKRARTYRRILQWSSRVVKLTKSTPAILGESSLNNVLNGNDVGDADAEKSRSDAGSSHGGNWNSRLRLFSPDRPARTFKSLYYATVQATCKNAAGPLALRSGNFRIFAWKSRGREGMPIRRYFRGIPRHAMHLRFSITTRHEAAAAAAA